MYTYTVLRGHDKNFTIPSLYNKSPLPRYFFQQIFHSIFLARKEKKRKREERRRDKNWKKRKTIPPLSCMQW